MSIYNSEGKPVRRKGSKGVLIGFFVVVILIVAFVAWIYYEAQRATDMQNAGCEVTAFNQWGQPTMWSCPYDADIDKSGLIE